MNSRFLTMGLSLLAVAASGCSKGQQCTPSAAECVGERAVLVCPKDGSAWSTYTCAAWEKCDNGACKAIDGIDVACTAGTAKCVTDRVLSVCVASGTAPSIVACQEGESCKDGACVSNATCTAGATECVSATLMRTCAADGKSWVASACAADQTCEAATNSCARKTDVFCTSLENDCVGGVPFVCKKDGSGFDTTACPANTHCVDKGRCQGNSANGCVVGTSCSGDTVVACASDGKTLSYTQCAIGHSCVVDPVTRVASCKQIVCEPGQRQCGNPNDPAADPGTFVSTCKQDGSGWAVARCETNSVCAYGTCRFDCLPGRTACSDNSVVTCSPQGQWDLASVSHCTDGQVCELPDEDGPARCADPVCAATGGAGTCVDADHFVACKNGLAQAAVECPGGCSKGECLDACIDGETRCTYSGGPKVMLHNSVETCTGGRWPGADKATLCNDPAGDVTPTFCIPLSELPGAHKAVCGDPACAYAPRLQCAADGQVQYCKDGVLQAAEACPAGQRCRTGEGCAPAECSDGETVCEGSLGSRACVGGVWAPTFVSCGKTATGTDKMCFNSLNADGKRVAQCLDPNQCLTGEKRCSVDGLGVQTCQADGTWGSSVECTYGLCSGGSCWAQCKPGELLCAGSQVTSYGQPAWTKAGKCSDKGRQPDWTAPTTDCAGGTTCRKDQASVALGCVECQGTRTANGYVDTLCVGDPVAMDFKVQFCGTANTWASGAAMTINCGNNLCSFANLEEPAQCVWYGDK